MTIALVQSSATQNTGGGDQSNVAVASQPTIGNLFVIGSCWPGSGNDPTAPAGWTQIGSTVYPYEGNKDSIRLFAKILAAGDFMSGGALGWQVPQSPMTSPIVMGMEFSGVASASPVTTGGVAATVPGSSPADLAASLTATGDSLGVMLTRLHGFSGSSSIAGASGSTSGAIVADGLSPVGLVYRIDVSGTFVLTTRATFTNPLWAGSAAGLFASVPANAGLMAVVAS